MNVFELNREEFLDELATRATATEIFDNAPEIYDFLTNLFKQNCMDSLLREWAFQWWAEVTESDYDEIYNRWRDNNEHVSKQS